MKKHYKGLIGILAAIVAVVGVISGGYAPKADALSSYFSMNESAIWGPASYTIAPGLAIIATSTTSIWGTYATTSPTYMTAGTATTTYTISGNTYNFNSTGSAFATQNADSDSDYLFISLTASTSATVLNWKEQFSNNNIDWFDENISILPTVGGVNTVLEASSSVIHSWQPGNALASTTGKAIRLADISAIYKRVVFSIPAGSPAGSIWVQNLVKRNASGQ